MGQPLVTVSQIKRRPARVTPSTQRAGAATRLDVQALYAELRRAIAGEVRFDRGSLGLYAQDASNYYHVPIGVVIPKTQADVVATVATCRRFGAPVLARTGGTGLAGQGANEAVVIDFSKYLRNILEVDPEQRRARVQMGVICDELVKAAEPYGLTWGPKPATHTHCGFGGMLANNCGGMHAQYAGIGVENVEAMKVLLYDGTELDLGWMDEADLQREIARGGREGRIYAELRTLRDHYSAQIRTGFPRLPRRVSGYNLDRLLPDAQGRFNLARTLVGSEGTCVTMLEATLRLVDLRPERVLVVAGYEDVYTAGDHVPDVLDAGVEVMALEGMDHVLRQHIERKGGAKARDLGLLPHGKGWLLIQVGADDKADAVAGGRTIMKHLRKVAPPVDLKMIENPSEQNRLWEIRESGLGATAFVPGEPDAWPGWEDSAVRPEQVGPYLRDLRRLFDRHGLQAALYGHFGMGCIHCRISFDLTTAQGLKIYRAFMDAATDLITSKYDGSLSGEHGDGQSRGPFLDKMFGPELVQAFREFKAIWDPDHKMNPGRIVDAPPITANLRLGTQYHPKEPFTHFQFPEDRGSFARATLRCVGVGKCRRLDTSKDEGVMCPSFLVTEEERHATRGRAHLLWELMRGPEPLRESWQNEAVKESLDLCLACKGCKSDCPVQVDMATYKAEFLSHYFEGRLRPREAYAFGFIDKWARLASLAPGLTNLLTHAPLTSRVAKLAARVHAKRTLPYFAPRTFRHWFSQRPNPSKQSVKRVMLWPDTFNNYFHPETGQAAVEVLEHLGFEVLIPDRPLCCGRPLYDYGLLPQARRYLEQVLHTLSPAIERGMPMVVLEPSCCSVFRDELQNLMPDNPRARRLQEQTLLLSEFLSQNVDLARLPRLQGNAMVQGHCHQKSVLGIDAERSVLEAMGLKGEVLDSSCCGMAGAFGFEKDKYEVGMACGERVLLPRVREADTSTLILANGFSCRTQIEQGTARHALHLADALKLAIHTGGALGAASRPPEHDLVRSRTHAVRRSMLVAGLGLVMSVGMGAAAYLWQRRRRL